MLKALARWPARRIALLWGILIALYAVLAIAGMRQSERALADYERRNSLGVAGELPAHESAKQDSVDAFLFATLRAMASDSNPFHGRPQRWRPTAAERDSIRRALDVPARLSAAQRDSLRFLSESTARGVMTPVVAGIANAIAAAAPWIIAALVLAYGLPLSLLVLTIAWAVARRRHRPPTEAAT